MKIHTLDGQHILVPKQAKCEACHQPSGGRLIYASGQHLCRACHERQRLSETRRDDEAVPKESAI